jgi:hypothetical protein
VKSGAICHNSSLHSALFQIINYLEEVLQIRRFQGRYYILLPYVNPCTLTYVYRRIAAATGNQKTYVKPEAAITVLSSLWWVVWWLSHRSGRQPKNLCKTRGCNYSFELLMMSGVIAEPSQRAGNQKTYVKPEAAITVLSSLWWVVWWLSHRSGRQPKNVCKTRGCNYSFELLMMSGVTRNMLSN